MIIGHVIGLLIPKSWTDAVGLSQQAYHLQALVLGAIAGFCTLVGVAILQLHTLIGMALFAIWPFTRLVHAFTAPVHYLFRPYIVYRSRTGGAASRAPRRGWERVS